MSNESTTNNESCLTYEEIKEVLQEMLDEEEDSVCKDLLFDDY